MVGRSCKSFANVDSLDRGKQKKTRQQEAKKKKYNKIFITQMYVEIQ